MTPNLIARLLDCRGFALFARIVLTFVFWGAGLGMAADYRMALAEMSHFGLEPAGAFAPAVIITLLAGSALVIADRYAWLGFGILAVFTALTIPIAHAFWTLQGEQAIAEFHIVTEHVTVIGALMVGAVLSRRTERARLAADSLQK